MAGHKKWLVYALSTTFLWGAWGALTAYLMKVDVPPTLVYTIWAFTMLIPCAVILSSTGWTVDREPRAIFWGCMIGFLGSGGQIALFEAVNLGPGHLIFPIVSLSPLITIGLSCLLLKEKASRLGVVGIVLALLTLPLFEYNPNPETSTEQSGWFLMALSVMAAWGLQAFFMKRSTRFVSVESIFFYMTITALATIPFAWLLIPPGNEFELDWSSGFNIAWIQSLNALGALLLVYAFRYGKAIIVAPLTNAGAPLISAVLTVIIIGQLPGVFKLVAIALATIAAVLLSMEPESETADTK